MCGMGKCLYVVEMIMILTRVTVGHGTFSMELSVAITTLSRQQQDADRERERGMISVENDELSDTTDTQNQLHKPTATQR